MSRLKELRKEKGYTQVKMQLLTGIDQSDYSKIENGNAITHLNNVEKLCGYHSAEAPHIVTHGHTQDKDRLLIPCLRSIMPSSIVATAYPNT